MQQQNANQQFTNKYDDVVKVNHQPTGGYLNPTAMAQSSMAMNNQFDNILRNLPGPPPPTVGSQMAASQPTSDPTYFKSKVKTITKLLVSNLPIEYDLEQVRDILSVVGPIKDLEKITDPNNGKYKGEVYVQYEKEEDSRKAETTLMGMNIKDAFLHVKKVQTTTMLDQDPGHNPAMPECGPSSCLVLTNLLIPETITDFNEYHDVEDETFEEMEQYGKVLQVVAPKPSPAYRPGMPLEPGVGRAYVMFDNPNDAQVGKEAMKGRRFEGRVVDAMFYPVEKFNKGQLE
jgi:splicing factor U2AF subunit